MNTKNLYNFNNQELVFFLQKIGQHEAAKIIQKYNIDGKTLLNFPNQNEGQFSDSEKSILWRCINLIQINPLSSVKILKVQEEDFEENSILSVDSEKNITQKLNDQSIDQNHVHQINERENRYIELVDLPLCTNQTNIVPRKGSEQYFIFSASNSQSQLQHKPGISSKVSSDYIHANSVILPRHEQIIVDRIKKYVSQEDIINSGKHKYEVILPDRVVIRSNDKKSKRKGHILCDMLLNLFCCTCTIGCNQNICN